MNFLMVWRAVIGVIDVLISVCTIVLTCVCGVPTLSHFVDLRHRWFSYSGGF